MTPYASLSQSELVAACEAKDIEIDRLKRELSNALARIEWRDLIWESIHGEEL